MTEKFMKKFIPLVLFVVLSAVSFPAQDGAAAGEPFTHDSEEFALELPNGVWRVVSNTAARSEFVYGDRYNAYLRIRKDVLGEAETLSDYAARQVFEKLKFMSGLVEGKEENFTGRLSGITFSYEYTVAGKAMAGHIYYLRADGRTIYVLSFTGSRDRLHVIRNQTDSIARSFKLKK